MDSSRRWLETGLKVEMLGDDFAMDLPATCPVLVVLNKIVTTFGKKSNLKVLCR